MRLRPGLFLLAASFLFLTPSSPARSPRSATEFAVGSATNDTQRSPYSAESQARQRQREQMRAQAAIARMHAHPATSPHTSSTGGGIIETIAGSAPFQSPTTALKAGLGQTQGVVEDTQGNFFVSTGDLRTILKIDSAGNVTVYAGVPLPTGPAVASGDGGPATAATLVSPMGLAIDASGNLYIADSGSFTVREVAATTGIISTVAGVAGSFGHTGDGGPATSATLQRVQSLVLDGNGNLFISDTNYAFGYVRELNLSSGQISTFAGANPDTSSGPVLCSLLYTEPCSATNTVFPLGQGPSDLAYYQGILYATLAGSDVGLSYPAVVSIPVSTGNAQVILGGTTYDPQIGAGIAIDAAGNLDITGYGTISQLKAGGKILTTIVGNGQFGYAATAARPPARPFHIQ